MSDVVENGLPVAEAASGLLAGELVSRRGLLRLAAVGAGAILAGRALFPDQASADTDPNQVQQAHSGWNNREIPLVVGAEVGASAATSLALEEGLGIGTGNPYGGEDAELLRINPRVETTRRLLVLPIVIEGIRALISGGLDRTSPRGRGTNRYISGTVVAGVNAGAYYINGYRRQEREDVHPVPQFIGAWAFWQLLRRGGYGAALMGHALHNLVQLPLDWYEGGHKD